MRKPIRKYENPEIKQELANLLFGLGLTIQDVATATNLESLEVERIRNTLKKGSSLASAVLQASVVNHKERRDHAYSAALKLYADTLCKRRQPLEENPTLKEHAIAALENYLDVPRLRGIAEGVTSYVSLQMRPPSTKEYDGYHLLLRAIFGDRSPVLHPDEIFNDFLLDICAESIEPPTRDNVGPVMVWSTTSRYSEYFRMPITRATTQVIDMVLGTISPRQANVIRRRFGIGFESTITLEECGKIFQVDAYRIRQIEAKGLKQLRNPQRSKALTMFVVSPQNLATVLTTERAADLLSQAGRITPES